MPSRGAAVPFVELVRDKEKYRGVGSFSFSGQQREKFIGTIYGYTAEVFLIFISQSNHSIGVGKILWISDCLRSSR